MAMVDTSHSTKLVSSRHLLLRDSYLPGAPSMCLSAFFQPGLGSSQWHLLCLGPQWGPSSGLSLSLGHYIILKEILNYTLHTCHCFNPGVNSWISCPRASRLNCGFSLASISFRHSIALEVLDIRKFSLGTPRVSFLASETLSVATIFKRFTCKMGSLMKRLAGALQGLSKRQLLLLLILISVLLL